MMAPGEPSKKWIECVMEDRNLLGVEEHLAQPGSMHVESSQCPFKRILDGKIQILNENDDDECFLKCLLRSIQLSCKAKMESFLVDSSKSLKGSPRLRRQSLYH